MDEHFAEFHSADHGRRKTAENFTHGWTNSNGTASSEFPVEDFDESGASSSILSSFIIHGLGITPIATLGVLGNVISALVLSRPQMRSSVSCLLLGLAFCDTLLISISILIFGLPAISDYSGTMLEYRFHFYPLWVRYLYPISITAQTGSVYLTLSVTIERYVAVCYSLHARSLCTWRRARACVLIVLLLASAYNAPRWFEVCVEETEWRLENNASVYENVMCPLRSSSGYKTYYINWSYLLVMYLVPFLGLVLLNWAIYQQVRRANRARQILSKLQRREMGLATMLLFVVGVFLLCNVLPLVNNILESFYDDMSLDILVQVSNFLVVLNSSVNFVIYCTCGERFRRLLVRMAKDVLLRCDPRPSARARRQRARDRAFGRQGKFGSFRGSAYTSVGSGAIGSRRFRQTMTTASGGSASASTTGSPSRWNTTTHTHVVTLQEHVPLQQDCNGNGDGNGNGLGVRGGGSRLFRDSDDGRRRLHTNWIVRSPKRKFGNCNGKNNGSVEAETKTKPPHVLSNHEDEYNMHDLELETMKVIHEHGVTTPTRAAEAGTAEGTTKFNGVGADVGVSMRNGGYRDRNDSLSS